MKNMIRNTKIFLDLYAHPWLAIPDETCGNCYFRPDKPKGPTWGCRPFLVITCDEAPGCAGWFLKEANNGKTEG